jgi:hypothetical protein
MVLRSRFPQPEFIGQHYQRSSAYIFQLAVKNIIAASEKLMSGQEAFGSFEAKFIRSEANL